MTTNLVTLLTAALTSSIIYNTFTYYLLSRLRVIELKQIQYNQYDYILLFCIDFFVQDI